jgi:tetratricopeptide (TPR) repeat protein
MAWNWIGVLHLQRRDLDAAEAAFLKVLSGGGNPQDVRSYAHCNLAYVFKHRNDLDRAIRSAQRSVIYAEEDGKDAYFGRFAELYFRLLRDAPGDAESARVLFDRLVGTDEARRQLVRDLKVEPNAPVLEAFRRSSLARLLPEL